MTAAPIDSPDADPSPAVPPERALVVEGLRKDFASADRRAKDPVRAVDGIDFTARFGQVTALLGTNGAGKTTTLSCAQGLQKPTAGTVRLLGQDPWNAGPGLRARVGIMLQDGGLPQAVRPMALLRHVASMYRDPADVDALAARLGIDGFDSTSIRRLSGGQKQRVALAAAVVGRPEVLFLDEPSAGLDPQSRKVVFDLVRELRDAGTAIVLTTHLMDDAQRLADWVYIIDAGANVVDGRIEDLLAQGHHDKVLRFSLDRHGLALADVFGPELAQGLVLREEHPGSYELSGPLTPHHLSALAAGWEHDEILPHHLDLQPRTLEDLFLEISGGDLR